MTVAPKKAWPPPHLDFMSGGGEMGDLMRRHDWAGTRLGSPEGWPQSLRAVISLLLNSKFPMLLVWGPELSFLYNDAYRPILGRKHPDALGRPFDQVWSEIWPDIAPRVGRVLSGEATFDEDLPLVLERHGYPERTHFTFSYSPVRDETGGIGGLFCACTETTAKVAAESRLTFQLDLGDRLRGLSDPVEAMAAAAEALGIHLGVAEAGYSEVDAAEEYLTVERDWTDGTLPSLVGRYRLDDYGPDLIREMKAGRTVRVDDVTLDPRTAGQAAASFAALGVRSVLAVPLVREGRLIASMFLHHTAPRRWGKADVALAEDVAQRTWHAVERARVEAALRESESRFRTLVDLVPAFVWFADPDGALRYCNDRWHEYTGQPPEQAIPNGWLDALHPEDAERTAAAWMDARARGVPYEVEIRYRRRDGEHRWYLARAEPVRDASGAVIGWFGTSTDIHDRALAENALRDAERRLNAVLDNASVAVFLMDDRQHCVYMNAAAERLTGYALAEIQGRPLHDAVHHTRPDGRPYPLAECPIGRAFPENAREQGEETFVHKDGGFYPVGFTASPIRDESARTVGTIIEVRDIRAEKEAERQRRLLIGELNHRVKNSLATVQAIANQTFRSAGDLEEGRLAFSARLAALAKAHDVLTRESWEGADLTEIVSGVAAAHRNDASDGRFEIRGPAVRLRPKLALSLAMALHELSTNAAKYGALSVAGGRIAVTWSVADHDARLFLDWSEGGGPPVRPPTRRGFGSRLLERGLALELGGSVRLSYEPAGVRCLIEAPLAV